MGRIEQFEDLIAWQKARELTQEICRITRKGEFAKDYGLSNQIQRAAVFVMSNIAEGFERNNPGDFQRFLIIAKASCGEVRSQLYVALDTGYIDSAEFETLSEKAREVSKIISGLNTSVGQRRHLR